MPFTRLIGPIPAVALVPFAMVFFADPFYSAASLIALAVWFPVTMLTTWGIANVPVSYLDVARTLGAGRFYLVFRVAIPAAMPNIFIGLLMGLCPAFLTLIAAESIGVQAGLGYYLMWRKGFMEYDKVFAALVIITVFCSGLMTLLFTVRNRVLRWQKGVVRW
jgi:NitT/TauT family transport system permease protein